MLSQRIINQINGIGLKMELDVLEVNVNNALEVVELQVSIAERLIDTENLSTTLQSKLTKLLKLINDVNEIEEKAYAYNEHELVFRCEELKSKVATVMENIRGKYMF